MNRIPLLLLVIFLSACSGGLPLIRDANTPIPPNATIPASGSLLPTPTVVVESADGVGRAFYRAWEGQDFAGMYSLLTPQSQALVSSEAFIGLYESVMETASVRVVRTQPLAALQEDTQASMTIRVTWETAIVGTIVRDHTVDLAFTQGRWGVVWSEALILPELQGGQTLHMDYRIPSRANIYDIDGQAMAFQGTAITLGVEPGRITDEANLLALLSQLLNQTPDELRQVYADAPADWFVPLGEISAETMQANIDRLRPYFEVGLVTRERLARLYPENGIAPHAVGYMGYIPAELLKGYRLEGYRGDELVGLAGLEAWGEPYLRGTRGGVLTIIGSSGEYISTIAETEPRQARSLYTTLDATFQKQVEEALAEAILTEPIAQFGSVVVMDVNTGEVKAIASYPTYNPAIFDTTRPNGDVALSLVLNDSGNPLLNRAAQGAYPAGSIFKLVTLASGLNSGLYTVNSRYTSTGTWDRFGEAYIKRDWREGGHGTVNYLQALTVSCNSCFYDMAYNVDEADIYLLPDTANQFGLGQPTGIQGFAESPGLIGDPDWKLATYGDGWARGDAVNMAIGQGFLQVTPLQMANVFSAIANGGTLYRPRIIDRIGAGGGAPEEVWPAEVLSTLPITPDNLISIRSALREVVTASYGTATHRFEGLTVPVAGKTGTAEAPGSGNGLPHAWFGGYAPAGTYTRADGTITSEPEIAIIIMVENVGEGSAVAAPIFRRVVELYYGITPLTPFPWQP